LKVARTRPIYSIGVMSELLAVHPETIRVWEKSGVVYPPQRRSGKRFYSENDFKRLQFIHRLVEEGLTLRAIRYYLRLYPCWRTVACPGCVHASGQANGVKPCWQEPGAFCQAAAIENPCAECPAVSGLEQDMTGVETNTSPSQPDFGRSGIRVASDITD